MMSAKLQESGAKAQEPVVKKTDNASAAIPTPPALDNVTATGKSPYVRSQKNSPIRWQIWGTEAIERAKADNKLIFLHIGFSASHYCYLTIQESFSNRQVIELLNEHFIPIIVDREERPDLDSIYINYVQSLNSAAGHPLNVFLTPELEPVFGGTYFPSPGSHQIDQETGEEIADFLVVLRKAQSAWAGQEAQVRADGKQSVDDVRKMTSEGTLGGSDDPSSIPTASGDLDIDQLEEAYSHISKTFDRTYGGFLHLPANPPPNFFSGNIPIDQMREAYDLIKRTAKFLTPAKLSFLLRVTQYSETVLDIIGADLTSECSNFAMESLSRIADGAIHDQVGAGFHRCSTTWDWSLPTFEKMLSDNALALGVYLDAWLLQGAPTEGQFFKVVFELADYLTSSPILLQGGGFASSEAADSSNKQGDTVLRHGAHYLWTRKEFDTVIGEEQERAVTAAYWNVKEHGNVEKDQDPNDEYLNQNVLRVVKSVAELSSQFKITESDALKLIESARSKLSSHRIKERPRPALDAKVVTAYNGMAIGALARTYAACKVIGGIPRTNDYLTAATGAALFVQEQLWDDRTKTLYRMYYDGDRGETEAFSEDYAFLIEGLVELYEATAEESWLEWADDLQFAQIAKFYDSPDAELSGNNARCGAFYRTTQEEPHSLLRMKDVMDTSQPSDNAVSASNLFRLGALLGNGSYTRFAQETVHAFEAEILQYPYLFPGMMTCVVASKLGVKRWVAVGDHAEGLAKYYRSPRGALSTLFVFRPESKLARSHSDSLVEELGKQKDGVYRIETDGQLLPIL
ncbi:Spermatogenesis-associated protein 20 [Seiridium cupressi]